MWIEIIVSLITVYVIWKKLQKPPNLPPGPWGLPLVGYLPRGTKNFHKKLKEMQKEHGDILSCRFGTKLFVFLCNYKLAKEAFSGTDFAARPDFRVVSVLEGANPLGIFETEGAHWHSLRRFSLRHLRDLGMGKSEMGSFIQFEATEIVKEMKKVLGKAIPIPYAVNIAVVNVIWHLTADRRYNMEDKEILEFEHLMMKMRENLSKRLINDFYPWIQYVVPSFLLKRLTKIDDEAEFSNKLKDFFRNIIRQHQESLDETSPRDYIDAYLIEMEKQKSNPDSTMSTKDLTHTVSDLFTAGEESVTATLQWAIYYLASFPNVQKRLQKEIDQVLPKEIQASVEEKLRLPYLEAFIHETLRYSSFAPHGAPHAASEDTTLGGYFIPKGTVVTAVKAFIHFDPRYFESPHEFRPERFLDSEGKFVAPKDGILAFGIGKRVCLGESLARMELLIFLSTLIQNLNFAVPPGKKIDIEPVENSLIFFPNLNQDVVITAR